MKPSADLYQLVLDEVARQKRRGPSDEPPQHNAVLFGLFVQEALTRRGLTRQMFADRLEMDPELADAILDGILPVSELNDDLLTEIGALLGYDAGTLSLILHRKAQAARPKPAAT